MKFGALLLAVLILFTIGACVPRPNQLLGANGPRATVAGFWLGVWQGFIAPFVFVVSLFRHDINIYEVHNNGAWYNFGYLFGLMCFFGGGQHRGRRARKPACG